ncbi:hypothetical protein GCM10010430_20340 [Kitasatospora cystarginea]|uniref:Uncharacterized protein n=1 Tax=Kitasatospora cystarginea TaxID=58350 RepID=A0ABP5QL39_9ACTN
MFQVAIRTVTGGLPGRAELVRTRDGNPSAGLPPRTYRPPPTTHRGSGGHSSGGTGSGGSATGGGSGPVVHPGAFCSPEGATGITSKGTPMVCGRTSDGRDRWHAA